MEQNTLQEKKLSFWDKYITPLTKAYRDFAKEIKNTPSEMFHKDGERKFSKQEEKFLEIFNFKNKPKPITPKERIETIVKNEKELKEIIKNNIEKELKKEFSSIESKNPKMENSQEKIEVLPHLKNAVKSTTKGLEDTFLNEDGSIMRALNITDPQKKEKINKIKEDVIQKGFSDSKDLTKGIEIGIDSKKDKFEVVLKMDKTMLNNTSQFTLNFDKSQNGEVYLKSFTTELHKKNNEKLNHTFKAGNVTPQESVNLLEGRAVKTAITNKKTQEKEEVFAKLKLKEEKQPNGNYKTEFYNAKKFDLDTKVLLDKSNIIFSDDKKDNLIKLLEKGDIVPIQFLHNKRNYEGFAVLNPQYKSIHIYDKEMNRVNFQKPFLSQSIGKEIEKAQIKQHNLSRGIGS